MITHSHTALTGMNELSGCTGIMRTHTCVLDELYKEKQNADI